MLRNRRADVKKRKSGFASSKEETLARRVINRQSTQKENRRKSLALKRNIDVDEEEEKLINATKKTLTKKGKKNC